MLNQIFFHNWPAVIWNRFFTCYQKVTEH